MREFVTMSECPEEDANKLQMKNFGEIAALRPAARLQDRNFAISAWKKGKKNQCPADAASISLADGLLLYFGIWIDALFFCFFRLSTRESFVKPGSSKSRQSPTPAGLPKRLAGRFYRRGGRAAMPNLALRTRGKNQRESSEGRHAETDLGSCGTQWRGLQLLKFQRMRR